MSKLKISFVGIVVTLENLEKFNEIFDTTIPETGVSFGWGDFEGIKLVDIGDNQVDFDFPSFDGEFLERDSFIEEFAKVVDAGNAKFIFEGSKTQTYTVVTENNKVLVKKFEDRPTQIGETITIDKTPAPTNYDTTINSGENANNISYNGAGSLEFNAIATESLNDPSDVNNLKSANIKLNGSAVGQVDFNSAYTGESFKYIDADGNSYSVAFAETEIVVSS